MTVGGVAATSVAIIDSTTIQAVTGAHGAGPADVMVTVGSQMAVLTGGFTFISPRVNSLPVIESLSIQGARMNEPADFADLGEDVVVTAVVRDAETPVDKLQFGWKSVAGVFSGTGSSVRWRAPAVLNTPAQVT